MCFRGQDYGPKRNSSKPSLGERFLEAQEEAVCQVLLQSVLSFQRLSVSGFWLLYKYKFKKMDKCPGTYGFWVFAQTYNRPGKMCSEMTSDDSSSITKKV